MDTLNQTPMYLSAMKAAELRGPKLTADAVKTTIILGLLGLTATLVYGIGWLIIDALKSVPGSERISNLSLLVPILVLTAVSPFVLALSNLVAGIRTSFDKLDTRLNKFLPTKESIVNKRKMLKQLVVTAEDVLKVAEKIRRTNQFKTWNRLSELDDAVERLAELGETLKAVKPKGTLPDPVFAHVQAAEQAFNDTMTPECISDAVVSYLTSYVEVDRRSIWHRDIDWTSWGFFDMSLRFSCRSNLDWAMVNTWYVAGSSLFDPSQDEDGETMTRQERFLSWWCNPAEQRPSFLPYDRILMHVPFVAYKVKAWKLEDSIQQYPINQTLVNIVDSNGAPIEYVTKLWQDSVGRLGIGTRIELKRIVNAARKIAR